MARNKKKLGGQSANTSSRRPSAVDESRRPFMEAPVWSFKYCDEHHEKWGTHCNGALLSDIIAHLKSFEGMRICDIFQTGSHRIPVSRISKEAQERLIHRSLEAIDSLYSFRITGEKRVWSILIENVVFILWIDPEHEVCPVNKKHT
ncbi:hypothetical protein LJC20_00310 [Eubacteriales bacterium OttesenSCG-928-M02]|nr:hypothetical protein [Eubacteriales bacterium OttesenSCG-928-M02]